jgi:hypothetical protein
MFAAVRKYLLSLLLLASAAVDAVAQDEFVSEHRRFFSLYKSEVEDLRFSAIYQPENDEADGSGEFDLLQANIKLETPYAIDDDSFSILAFEYDARNYDLSGVEGTPINSSPTFHKIQVGAGLGKFINDDFMLVGTARLGVFSDFESDIDENAVRLYGDGAAVYRVNPGTQFVLGAAYNEIFDDYPIYPMNGLRVISEDGTIHLSMTFPTDAQFGYNLVADSLLFAKFVATGEEYRSTLEDKREVDVHVQDKRLGFGARHWFTPHVNLGAEIGISLDGELKYKVSNPEVFTGDTDPAPYAAVNLGFAF